MATLKGMDAAARAINRAAHRALSGSVAKFLKGDAMNDLNAQIQPDGSPFPDKAESTKRAYRRRGWDTERFLVRTGKSVRLTHEVYTRAGTTTLEIRPMGWETLSYHVPDRVEWFSLTPDKVARCVQIMNEEIDRELNA